MAEKHLYVIGNGFDIHHNMNTSYTDFKLWLNKNVPSILYKVDEVFGYCSAEWWADFENNLSNAITTDIVSREYTENNPNIGSDDFRDSEWTDAKVAVENVLAETYDIIRQEFVKWVKSLNQGDSQKKIVFHRDYVFLSFNYTSTLEDLYGISRNKILYIHGKVGEKGTLVLGHGDSIKEIEKKFDDQELLEAAKEDYALDMAIYGAIEGVYSQRKKVDEIIKKNETWFNSLKDVTHIHIYGHSLSKVDMPYFQKIFEIVDKNKVEVEVSYYSENDKNNIQNFMETISLTGCTMVRLCEILVRKHKNLSLF